MLQCLLLKVNSKDILLAPIWINIFLYALSCTKCQKFNLLQCFNDMHKPLTKCQNQHHPYDKDDVVFDILSLYVENLFNYLMVNDIDCSEGCLLKLVASHEPLSKQTWKCYSKVRGMFIRRGCKHMPKFPLPI